MVRTALVCLVASAFVATISIVRNSGFGIGDLWPFLFWSIPFAVGIASMNFTKLFCRPHPLLRYFVPVFVGITAGILWTVIVRVFLGPWFGAFSFPVLFCWIAGGASGMIASCEASRRRLKVADLILVGSICFLAIVGMDPIFVWLSNDQQLEVTFIKWTPKPETLSMQDIDDPPDYYGSVSKEFDQLKEVGLTGKLAVFSGGRYGAGNKHSRVIIVMQRQLEKRSKDLPQPDGVNVIYIQDENNNWRIYPSGAPTLQRTIRLEIPENKENITDYWVELASGARQGGQAFFWE
jgi:hypothetical protein